MIRLKKLANAEVEPVSRKKKNCLELNILLMPPFLLSEVEPVTAYALHKYNVGYKATKNPLGIAHPQHNLSLVQKFPLNR